MIKALRNHSIWLTLILLLVSCRTAPEKTNEKQVAADTSESYPQADIFLELTEEQEAAFDALNMLQTSTDEMNLLYSTFANAQQACYPPDTNFTISRSELLAALEHFVAKYCKNLPIEERNKLASAAVLAQEEYIVLFCSNSSTKANYDNGIPMSGTWAMPNILGRRDVVIEW